MSSGDIAGDGSRYDYVVVGAGSAGCVLAARLSEDKSTRVLVLEAGPRPSRATVPVPALMSRQFQTELDWGYVTAPQAELENRRLYWARGRGLGGTSLMNGQVYCRGHRRDFDGWAEAGNQGWDYDSVLPYFTRSERNERGRSAFHGNSGPVHVADQRDPNVLSGAFVRAAEDIGIPRNDDFNGPELDGVGYMQVTQRRGMRWGSADAYLKPAMTRPNLQVVTDAHVVRVLFEHSRAVGVEYIEGGRLRRVGAAAEVILSGGVVNSPQLLLLSGLGPGPQLQANGIPVVQHLPGVGRNLQDHVGAPVVVSVEKPVSLMNAQSIGGLIRFLLLRKGGLTSTVAEVAAFVRTTPDLDAPDLQLGFAPTALPSRRLFDSPKSWLGAQVRPLAVRLAGERFRNPSAHGFTIAPTVLVPASTGFVQLASADPKAPPVIQPAYLSDPGAEDLGLLVRGLLLARQIATAEPFKTYGAHELHPGVHVTSEEQVESFVRENLHTAHHAVGTCRMGVDDMAVVDPQLRVIGVDGLRVADASIMPTIVRGHTHAPTVMIAEKAVDMIRAARAERLSGRDQPAAR